MKRRGTYTRSQLLLFGALIVVAAVAMLLRTGTQANANGDTLADGITAGATLTQPATPSSPPASTPLAAGGMRAYIDPETGELASATLPPLSEEEKALLEPTGEPRQVILPDGSVMLELNGTCQEFMVMQVHRNGDRSVNCAQNPQKALQGATSASPEER